MVRTMTESLNSAELLKQLKSLGLEKLLHVTHKFLRQSYIYPPLLNFGGKTLLITSTTFVVMWTVPRQTVCCPMPAEAPWHGRAFVLVPRLALRLFLLPRGLLPTRCHKVFHLKWSGRLLIVILSVAQLMCHVYFPFSPPFHHNCFL